MRNRNLVMSKTENLEGFLRILRTYVKTGRSINEFLETLDKADATLDQIKSMIEREPLTQNEINKF